MICDGCICMTCTKWESCPYYARCEVAEIDSCEQKKDCCWYCPEEKE